MKAQTVITGKGQIEFTLLGQGEPILFVHGGHSNCYEDLFHKGFDTSKYCIITPSRPGYGKTLLTKENQSPKGAADLILSLLDSLNITQVNVIGISAGGLTAIEIAANYNVRVKNLVLISALTKKWFNQTDKIYRKGKKLFSPNAEKYSWSLYKTFFNVLPKLMTKVMFKEISKYRPVIFTSSEIAELKEMTMKMRSFQGFNNDLDQNIEQEILEQIKCPTLILHSNYDNAIDKSHPKNAKHRIRNSKLIFFDNRWGHLLWLGDEYKKPLNEIEKHWNV